MLQTIKIPHHFASLVFLSILLILLTGCIQDTRDLSGTAGAAVTPTPPLVAENLVIDVTVPSGATVASGVCSQTNVVAFDYTVTAPAPGLYAVLAASKASYDALWSADLSNPNTANLPAPMLDMSCTAPYTTTCQKTFPANRKLKPQVMCILLKNTEPNPIQAKVDVTWYR